MLLDPLEEKLSGKGLARYRISTRFQPLPIRTAREVFPQAAHPVNFIIRVMRPIEWWTLSSKCLYVFEGMDFPVPIQPQHVIQVFVTPSPPSDTTLLSPFSSRQQGPDFHFRIVPHFTEGVTGIPNPKVVHPPASVALTCFTRSFAGFAPPF